MRDVHKFLVDPGAKGAHFQLEGEKRPHVSDGIWMNLDSVLQKDMQMLGTCSQRDQGSEIPVFQQE